MMNSYFFRLVVALIVIGTIDVTITLAALTLSQMMTATAVMAVIAAVFWTIVTVREKFKGGKSRPGWR